jgi:hypothetical protein
MRSRASSVLATVALIALACALPLAGCGGNDDSGSGHSTIAASATDQGSTAAAEGAAPKSSKGNGSTARAAAGEPSGAQSQATPAIPATPTGPGATAPDQQPFTQALQHPKKPHKSQGGGNSSGGPNAGLSPQESATYETARALCANRDSLQYAPEDIRDDAEALAEFAERFAPPGEEQVVHDGCLVGLKSIGID